MMTRKEVEKLRDLYLKLTFDPSRCRFDKPGEHFTDRAYTVEVQEATRVYRESWILPEIAGLIVKYERPEIRTGLARRVAEKRYPGQVRSIVARPGGVYLKFSIELLDDQAGRVTEEDLVGQWQREQEAQVEAVGA